MDAKYHLGLPVCQATGKCPAYGCRAKSDNLWEHSLSCRIWNEQISHNKHMREALYNAAKQAGFCPL